MSTGGIGPRRLDQRLLRRTAAGTGPAPSSNVVVAQIVIIGGGGVVRGLFVYNGTPGAGNSPILSIVPPSVTKDPYGNAVASVLEIQDGGVPVFQFTDSGQFFTYNAHGAVVMALTNQGFFQYQDLGSATQGGLILVIASNAGNDPVNSTPYAAGMTGIDPAFGDSIVTVGANIDLNQVAFTAAGVVAAHTGSGATAPFTLVNGPEQGVSGHVQMQISGTSPDGTVPSGLLVAQGVTGTNLATRSTSAPVEIQESDGNIYTAGDSTKIVASNIVINQTTFSQAIWSAWQVAKGGTYNFASVFWYTTGAAAGIPEFQVAGSAIASMSAFQAEFKETGVAAYTGSVDSLTPYGTTMNGPGMTGAGTTYVCYVQGSATFSAAGTFRVQAATNVAADTYTILAGSFGKLTRTG